ncbi:MAG TPA: FecR domain-containing protein [Tepidisphaeraceae bacterium]|nr:FecR domain-containing protein [Tepidisphaeraceae bacterium]
MTEFAPDDVADRTERLLAGWRDGALAPAELDELTALLARDPSARRALVAEFSFGEAVGPALGTAGGVRTALAAPRRARPWRAPVAVAASLILGLGIWWAARGPHAAAPRSAGPVASTSTQPAAPVAPAIATLADVAGVVTVGSAEAAPGSPAVAGQALAAGLVVRTGGDDSGAVILYADGTRLELGAESVVRLGATGTAAGGSAGTAFGKHAVLSAGVVRADVAPQPAGRPMLLTTPQAEVRVLGTRFTSAITAAATRVDLDEGRLRVVRTADDRAVDVGRGEYVVAAASPAGGPLAARPVPAYVAGARYAFDKRVSVEALALSPDGRTLALGRNSGAARAGETRVIELYELSAGEPRLAAVLPTGRPPTRSLAFSPDGARLAAGYRDSYADVWDVAAGRVVRTWEVNEFQPTSLAFSRGGEWLAASLDRPNGVPLGGRVWSTTTGAAAPAPPHEAKLRPVLAIPGGDALLAGERSGRLVLWDPATGAPRGDYDGLPKPTGLAASADGRTIAVAGDDRVVVLDAATGGVRQVLAEPGRRFRPVALSPDGRLVAAGAGDGTVTLWQVADGAPVATLRADTGGVRWVAFTPDGRTLVTGAFARPPRLWDVPPAPGR